MIEVEAALRFNQHSLGDRRHRDISRMLRAPDGRVMFLPTWWQSLMRYAAKVLNKHHDDVKEIDWSPIVIGDTSIYRRYYAPGKFTAHEAFMPGDIIQVHAVIPTTLPLDDFKELLDIAGKYKGISPYRSDKQYGTFDVTDVQKRTRGK